MERRRLDLTAAGHHHLAQGRRQCDHMWATLFPAAEWLTWMGRIAFPLFAFMVTEGYFRTHDLRRYFRRLLVWALIPIWLYRGRQGPHGKTFRFMCYAFYPAHMLVLAWVHDWMLR